MIDLVPHKHMVISEVLLSSLGPRECSAACPLIQFSVCIPNYNYARFLGKTIQSVLEQTYQDFEIIVADNASTDDSLKVARSFRSEKIRLIENSYNIGFSPNLDRATEMATKDFIILLSSDDLIHPDALATYAKVLSDLGARAKHTVLTSAVDVIDEKGKLSGVLYRPKGSLFYREVSLEEYKSVRCQELPIEENSGLEVLAQSLRAKDSPAAFLATCYPRVLYDKVNGYNNNYRVWPDTHFLRKLLAEDPAFIYVPQRLFSYRVHNRNQLAGEAGTGALIYQVDSYMHTVEFPDETLKKVGVKREELVQVFIEKGLMERGLQSMAANNRTKAFKCLAFGFATYPGRTLRQPKTYALASLLFLGPLGSWIARKLYERHLRRKATKAEKR